MGCDIELHVEIKTEGRWLHYRQPYVDRNYDLFAKMAGVRNRKDLRPIAAPRGLPEDVTGSTEWAADYRGSDGHSHSYLTASELAELEAYGRETGFHFQKRNPGWMDKQFGWLCGNSIATFAAGGDRWPANLEDVRVVFWFDN